jgi:hypothetical protein
MTPRSDAQTEVQPAGRQRDRACARVRWRARPTAQLVAILAALALLAGWSGAAPTATAQPAPSGDAAPAADALPPPATPQPAAPDDGEGPILDPPGAPGGAGGGGGTGADGADGSDGVAPAPTAPQQRPRRRLTDDELRTLMRGPISPAAWAGGGILGTWLGFGVGHAVQGRFWDAGVIFTAGEGLSIFLMVASISNASLSNCSSFGCRSSILDRDTWEAIAVVGGLSFAIFRVWEIVDVWYGPVRVNAYHRELQERHGQPSWSLNLSPTAGGGAVSATLRF